MGLQSSRIIWGRDKMPGPNEPQPVGLYDPNGTLYINGNYAIVSKGNGGVAEDYHLYLCTAAESGGDFNEVDWKEQKGIKNWYLVSRRQYKKGARVIKEDTNGDFETMKLYRCKDGMKRPNVWNDDEWELVYQDVGVAYQMRDHKEVYYDDGKNKNKWHRQMYYMPPDDVWAPDFDEETEYNKGDQATYNGHVYTYKRKGPYIGPWVADDWALTDNKVWSEVTIFDPEWQYHYEDQCIHEHPVSGWGLYKYKNVTPYRGEWSEGRWDKVDNVSEYETNVAYKKNDIVIKLNVEVWDVSITDYQPGIKYSAGKYCLNYIDRSKTFGEPFDTTTVYERGDLCTREGHRYRFNQEGPYFGPFNPLYFIQEDLFPIEYQERIIGGETVYGLYKSNQRIMDTEWDETHWDLMTNETIQVKGRDYNRNNNYIMQFIIGYNYTANDLCIWTSNSDGSEFGLNVALTDIFNCSPKQGPPNEEYWKSISEILDGSDQQYAFKAVRDISAEDNQSWQIKNWAVVEQKIDPDDGLYGIIWEKYGKPGGGAGIPFGFPLVIDGRSYYDPEGVNYANLDILYPFMGNSCLEIEKTFEAHDWGTPCSRGVSYLTNIVYTLYSNESLVRKLMVYSLTGFRELTFTDFTGIQTMSFNNDGIIYYDRLGYRIVNGGTDYHIPYGKFYKSYFGIDNVFGKILLVDIPQEIGGKYCWFRPYYSSESPKWNDPDDDYLYIDQRDDVPLLVSITPIGKLMNIPSSNTDLEDTSRFGQCWQDIDLYERHLCYITDDGDIVELEYFKDIYAGISTWSNGTETVTTDEYFVDLAMNYIYGGRMLNRTGFDPFPGMYTTYGLHNVGGLNPYSPWFDEDWNLFPDIELVEDEEYYLNIGQVFLLYKDAAETQQILSHLQAFCNRYGLDYHTDDMGGGNDMWASARANKYYKFTDEGWYASFTDPIVQKRGYAYKDRYGNVYILVHKTMGISYYSYDYETNVVSRLHIWSVISNNENKQFYTYFSKYGGSYGSQNTDGELIIIGRHETYVLAGIRSGNTMTRHLIDLKTGTMSAGSFPRYVELPYIGNASSFRIGNATYTKARIYLGVDWSYYSSGDIPPEDDGTYKAVVPFNTYWTPYIANTGGVCHTGDLLTVTTVNSSAYTPSRMVVYIPQVMTNTMGIGGFIFLSGQDTSPSYGGPGENGFINK